MNDYSFAFGASATGADIRYSRAMQGKGLKMYYGFFTHLEFPQFEGAIGSQVFRGCLIESYLPIVQRTKIKEALRHLLTCLWRAHRIPKHNCNITRQSIVHQSFSIVRQEMQILRCQTNERKRMTAVVADQFCLWMRDLDKLFLWIEHWQCLSRCRPSMCRSAIIQLVRATLAKATGTGRGGLPQARWYSGAVLRHPGGESALLAPAKSSNSVSQLIPELLRKAIKNLWRQLSTPIERIQQEEAHRTTLDQGR